MTKDDDKMKNYSISLPPSLVAEVMKRESSKYEPSNLSRLVREAIAYWLSREDN